MESLPCAQNELLEHIEKYASIYMPISDIALLVGMEPERLRELVADKSTDISKAYRRGKVASKVRIRTQEMKLAMVGSPLALENARKNLLDMEDDE